jgi:hypothetical protein
LTTTSNNSITGTWSPAINNNATTNYTFTPNAGQCASNTNLTITINPLTTPAFDAVTEYCVGETAATLPVVSTNGITGSWNAEISTAVAGTTVYTFTSDAGQCATQTVDVAVTVYPLPTVSTYAPVEHQGTYILPIVEGGVWTNATGETVTEAAVTGIYTLTVTNENGCENSTTLTVDILTDTDNISAAEFSIYPNPNNGEFIIKTENIKNPIKYEIYDLLGRFIKSDIINSKTTKVELEAVSGTYYVKVITENKIFTCKLIIRH